MRDMLVVAVGAAMGANLRYLLNAWAVSRFGPHFPFGTLIVNLAGCLVIGILLTLAAGRLPLSPPLRLLLVTGLLGGFTTFSSFGYETYSLIATGRWGSAALYVGASVALGLGAVFLGAAIARPFAGLSG